MLMSLCTESGSKQEMTMSSMYRKALTCRPLLPGMITTLKLTSFLMDLAKGFRQRTSKAGEIGPTSLTPDLVGNLSDSYPLIETAPLML
eukprot:g46980.t1